MVGFPIEAVVGTLASQNALSNQSTVKLDVAGCAGCMIQLTGTWAGVVAFEGSGNGVDFNALTMTPTDSVTAATGATSGQTKTWQGSCHGLQFVRARMTSYVSGAAVVTMRSVAAAGGWGTSSGGGPSTIADGADVALGSTTDAGVITDTTGTVIGFLRGLVKRLLAQVLDYDTGAGVASQVIYGISLPASGGPVGVSNTNPLPATMGFGIPINNYCGIVEASTTTTYTFKTGGSSGSTVAVVVLTYTDSTKTVLLSAERTS